MGTKIVLIGAGSAQFGLGTVTDIFDCEALRGSHIVLHDINAQSLAGVEAITRQYIEENNLPYTLSATTSRREALQGADFCIISIEVGNRFALWEQDWQIPLQYGIRQVYGENGGPGGFFHALRIIPPILGICGDIMEVCPDAHVFNFSNPMSRICLTVKRRYPEIKLVGLCHEIHSLETHLPRLLNVPFDDLEVKAGGLNHFSVLLEARYRKTGKDAYPEIREKAPAYFECLPEFKDLVAQYLSPAPGAEPALRGVERSWAERGLFRRILDIYGYLPITTDSHFGEYIPWAYEVVDHRGILDFYRWYKRWCFEKEPQIGNVLGSERVIPIIEAILCDLGREELAVNVMNDGLIDNLPADLVVEVPAVVDGKGVHGVPLGTLPRGFAGLLCNQASVLDLTAETVLTGSKQVALQALLADPVVDSVRAAEGILDTMLDLQRPYLGYIE
ncbi:MAG: alpha-glucosidase [Anaerolineae bacterium]